MVFQTVPDGALHASLNLKTMIKAQRAERQSQFDFGLTESESVHVPLFEGACALEDDDFPFEAISDVAERESWRKEINRPIYHIHKWWAQRLGSVFRAITLGALTPSGTDILKEFYRPVRLNGRVVFDPFMGSGTTVGEAAKLGACAVGRDINPVAYFLARNAFAYHDRKKVMDEFATIERDVSQKIRLFYKTTLDNGQEAEVLYYFWVKIVPCPSCHEEVPLNSSQIFARHAYPRKYPTSRATCPGCCEVNTVRYDDCEITCGACGLVYNPQIGPAKGQNATCRACSQEFPIAKTVRKLNSPPKHKLYAKLVLLPDGSKEYIAASKEDQALYKMASEELSWRKNAFPVVPIEPGYNTNQALGYNYRYWHEMFNDRQLLCLSILADRIREIQDPVIRDLFTCLFSGTLEFNNMFASYKGEGTGAVRHMFAHHILKPERVPLEANVWGTRKSSGSFLTMFEGRIRRALDYAGNPFEQMLIDGVGKKSCQKVFGLSEPLSFDLANSYDSFLKGRKVYLSCGDSSVTDLAEKCVDAIITDPPFFDNVHYSQLADFFYVWQRHILGGTGSLVEQSTRSASEVQNADAHMFTDKLRAVWAEAHRVLKDQGILAFTYHHSRAEGWSSVLQALMSSGFGITATQPIKAEMSVAMPKYQAKEPIDIDIVLVCRKREQMPPDDWNNDLWGKVTPTASSQVQRMKRSGRRLSRNDVRVIVMAQLLKQLSISSEVTSALAVLDSSSEEVEKAITSLHNNE